MISAPFLSLVASGPFQSGKAATNWLTPDLAENTMTETDDGRDFFREQRDEADKQKQKLFRKKKI